MKKYIVGIILALTATAVYATCTTNTIIGRDGRMTVCTTCCSYGNCTTTCI